MGEVLRSRGAWRRKVAATSVAGALALSGLSGTAWLAGAAARELRIALDPDGPAFSIGGWDRQVAQTGTVFYQCREDACGLGSTVSVRRQSPPANPPSVEALRRDAIERGKAAMQRSAGAMLGVETGTPKVGRDKLLSRGEVTQTFTLAAGTTDVARFWKSGYIGNKAAAFTVSSSGRDPKQVDANYAVFNLTLALVLQRLADAPKPAE
jgi:hypothetical protein